MLAGGCNAHPCNGPTRTSQPCALRCLLFLCLAETLPDLALGQHASLVPLPLRWARSILKKQHLALSKGVVGAARSPAQPGRVTHRQPGSRSPGGQPCPCLLPIPRAAAQHLQLATSLGPRVITPRRGPGRGGPWRGADGDTE